VTQETLEQLLADRRAGRSVVVATFLATGAQWLLYPFSEPGPPLPAIPLPSWIDGDVRAESLRAAQFDRSTVIAGPEGDVFLHIFNPPLRLVIVGAVHIAQALCPMAALAGFAVIVIDPRTAFANADRFPGVALATDWPDEALAALAPNRRTAIVTLTHDPKLDDPALQIALASEAFYIGCLGSKKTQAARLGRLRKRGWDDAAVERISGPVGLNIGAKSAAEIAVAILAEVIQTLRRDPS